MSTKDRCCLLTEFFSAREEIALVEGLWVGGVSLSHRELCDLSYLLASSLLAVPCPLASWVFPSPPFYAHVHI